jgi:hypothetical protein
MRPPSLVFKNLEGGMELGASTKDSARSGRTSVVFVMAFHLVFADVKMIDCP